MTSGFATRLAVPFVSLLFAAGVAQAQSTRQPEPPAEEAEAEEGGPRYEAEFVASTIFQGGTVAAQLASPLTAEAHYFGVETNDIGMIGLAWTFSRGRLRVVPGMAWSFGAENRPAPVITARWSYEHRRWLTQGLWVQSLRAYLPPPEGEGGEASPDDENSVRHASILDGVHVSARIGRAEVGPLVEHVQYREENEWKGGVRGAWLVGGRFKLVGQVLGPGVEARAGFSWER